MHVIHKGWKCDKLHFISHSHRFDEKDYVVVRKSFQLLGTLCTCCGTFLKKRTIEETFPRLSTLLMTLAKDGEQVKDKNRQYYTYTQAYKVQLTVLQVGFKYRTVNDVLQYTPNLSILSHSINLTHIVLKICKGNGHAFRCD